MKSILEDGISTNASPQRVAIEKAQTELKQEYDVRDKRRRELEFLEKGGNPLEFKAGHADSISVQSTSHITQPLQHILTSAAKGSFPLSVSPPGISIESSGRPGGPTSFEPNSANNVLLIDCKNEVLEGLPSKKNSIGPSEHSSQLDGSKIAKESKDLAIFRPYTRRNRSRSNCDGGRSNSTDILPSRGGHTSSLPAHHSLRVTNKQKLSSNRDVHEGNCDITAPKDVQDAPTIVSTKNENDITKKQFSSVMEERDIIPNEIPNQSNCAALSMKNLDPESSCTKTSLGLEGFKESDFCKNTSIGVDNVIPKDQMMALERINNIAGELIVNEEEKIGPANNDVIINADNESVLHTIRSGLQNVVNLSIKIDLMETNGCALSETNGKTDNNPKIHENSSSSARPQCTIGSSISDIPYVKSQERDPADVQRLQTCDDRLKVINKAHEDSILEEARVIEAKRKRISELSDGTILLKDRRNSSWNFVLEEMAWMANDFAQERLWKINVASQISNGAALSSQSRLEEQSSWREQKKVAYTVAKVVMHFWRSIEELVNSENPGVDLAKDYGYEVAKGKFEEPTMETSNASELKCRVNIAPIRGYGVRFLKYNKMTVPCIQDEAPLTPDRISDLGILKSSLEAQLKEGSLFYKVPFGSMKTYRKSIESWKIQYEEEDDTSMHDAVGSHRSIIIGKQTNDHRNAGSFTRKHVRTDSQQKLHTKSFQGDHRSRTFYRAPQLQNRLEVDSLDDFENPRTNDSARPKKKKQAKHMRLTVQSGLRSPWSSIRDQGSASHLQGTLEEDTILSHFEKIISIEQKKHHPKSQTDKGKLLAPVHHSHIMSLSRFCSNKGAYLSPLELIEMSESTADLTPLETQSPHSMGLSNTNQGSEAAPVLNSLDANSPVSINAAIRNGNPAVIGRNNQQSSLPVPTRGGEPNGILRGMNGSEQMSRPGCQGIASSSSMLNSGSKPSSSQGMSMLRLPDSLLIARPDQNPEHRRQMMSRELQLQGNGQGVPHFNGSGPNGQPMSPNHPDYAQFKERRLHQQQQCNSRMQHARSHPQLPVNNSSSPLAGSVSSQLQQNHSGAPHQGTGRSPQPGASGVNNHISNQRIKQAHQQQLQQIGRQHPQQRHPQSQVNEISRTGLPPRPVGHVPPSSQLPTMPRQHIIPQSHNVSQGQASQQAVPSRQHPQQKQVNRTNQQQPTNNSSLIDSSREPVNVSVIQNPATPVNSAEVVQRQVSDVLPPHVTQPVGPVNPTKQHKVEESQTLK